MSTWKCSQCGKSFERKPSALRRSRMPFCSVRCKGAYQADIRDPRGQFAVAQDVLIVRPFRERKRETLGLVVGFTKDGKGVYVIRGTGHSYCRPIPRELLVPIDIQSEIDAL